MEYSIQHLQYFCFTNRNWQCCHSNFTLSNIAQTGGTVESLAISSGGKFYTSAPLVVVAHPGTSFASATIGLSGTSINPSSVAFPAQQVEHIHQHQQLQLNWYWNKYSNSSCSWYCNNQFLLLVLSLLFLSTYQILGQSELEQQLV